MAHGVAQALGRRRDVVSVLLHGSAARGLARADSDVDLFVVLAPTVEVVESMPRVAEELALDVLAYTEADWRARFARPNPTWLYGWAEAVPLFDPSGVGARLVSDAERLLGGYRTPNQVTAELLDYWRHVRPKMSGALDSGSERAIGLMAAISVDRLIETLFAVNDRPNPPGSNAGRLRMLEALTQPENLVARLDDLLTASAAARGRACLDLVDDLVELLSVHLRSATR